MKHKLFILFRWQLDPSDSIPIGVYNSRAKAEVFRALGHEIDPHPGLARHGWEVYSVRQVA